MSTVVNHIPTEYLLEVESLQDVLFAVQKIAEQHNKLNPAYQVRLSIELQEDGL